MRNRYVTLLKLKKALGRTAFASLIADIAISAVTVISLKTGQAYTIGIIFILNYILTAIVVVALVLMFLIAILTQRRKISKAFLLFRFRNWRQ